MESLLLLSQADAGKFPVGDEIVPLTEIIAELAEDIEVLGGGRGLTLEIQLAESVKVQGSSQFIRQMVMNLVDNAVKYSLQGGMIRCGLTTHKGAAIFRIANTGFEIPEADRERIFDRFSRVESSRARGHAGIGGHGLGLSLAREIARAHRGGLTIEASDPGWIVFQITLPLHADIAAERSDLG